MYTLLGVWWWVGTGPVPDALARGRAMPTAPGAVRRLLGSGGPLGWLADPPAVVAQAWGARALRVSLALGASPNARTHWGTPVLLRAIVARDSTSVRTLLAAGADPTARAPHAAGHATALHTAATAGDSLLVHQLLAAGLGVDDTTDDGSTPLLLAVRRQQVGTTQALLAHRPAVARADSTGMTPLAVAVLHGHIVLADVLLRGGADPLTRLPDGRSVAAFVFDTGRRPGGYSTAAFDDDTRAALRLLFAAASHGARGQGGSAHTRRAHAA